MGIEIILSDTDGCLVKEDKTKPPLLVDNTPNLPYLFEVRKFLESHPQLKFSTISVRSLAAGLPIIELVGTKSLCAFESGNIIYSPISGEAYLLVEREERLMEYREALPVLQRWMQSLDEKMVSERLEVEPSNVRIVSDRKTVLTFEILPYEAPPKNGQQLWKVLQQYTPPQVKKLIDEGKISVNPSRASIDISVNISKADAARHILCFYLLTREQAMGIGDRQHSDLPFLGQTKYVAAPLNADKELKQYTLDRGKFGYVSQFENGEGVIDILKHAERQWPI